MSWDDELFKQGSGQIVDVVVRTERAGATPQAFASPADGQGSEPEAIGRSGAFDGAKRSGLDVDQIGWC
jgi:hypothetical protein